MSPKAKIKEEEEYFLRQELEKKDEADERTTGQAGYGRETEVKGASRHALSQVRRQVG